MQSLASVAELVATFIMPFSRQTLGTLYTGLWGIWLEFACLMLVIVSFFIEQTSAPTLVDALMFSKCIVDNIVLYCASLTVCDQPVSLYPEWGYVRLTWPLLRHSRNRYGY